MKRKLPTLRPKAPGVGRESWCEAGDLETPGVAPRTRLQKILALWFQQGEVLGNCNPFVCRRCNIIDGRLTVSPVVVTHGRIWRAGATVADIRQCLNGGYAAGDLIALRVRCRDCDAPCDYTTGSLRMGIMRDLPVAPACRRQRACLVGQITSTLPGIPRPCRGALRDRHERWLRDAMDVARQQTNDVCHVRRSRVVLALRCRR